jgi:flagellar biosynthesis/type III secretory pathway protein FliH
MNSMESLSPSPTTPIDLAKPSLVGTVSMPRLRLVKAKEFEAHLGAQAIRKRAEARADQIIKDTLTRAAEMEAAARVKGERIGLQRYADALMSLDEARKSFAHDAEQQLISSVFSIVKQLLPTLPAHLVTEDIVVQLIRRDAHSRDIQLIVPMSQLEYATSQLESWRLEAGVARGPFSIEVKGDAQLDVDVCVLKSEFGSVTANLAEQLAALEKSARAAFASSATKPLAPTHATKPRATNQAKTAGNHDGAENNA